MGGDVDPWPWALETRAARNLQRARTDGRRSERARAQRTVNASVAANAQISAEIYRRRGDGVECGRRRIVRQDHIVHRVGVNARAGDLDDVAAWRSVKMIIAKAVSLERIG